MSDKQPIHPLLLGTTPGPWQRHDRTEIYSGGYFVGSTRGNGTLPEHIARIDEANAKLIAQAPSLAAENAALAEQVDRLRAMVDRAAGLAGLSPWVADPPMKELLLKFCADARDLLSKYK